MKKIKTFRMRMTQKDYDDLKTRSEKAGMTAAKYIRSLIFPKKAKKMIENTDKTPELNVGTQIAQVSICPHDEKKFAEQNVGTKPLKAKKIVSQPEPEVTYRRLAAPGSLLKK